MPSGRERLQGSADDFNMSQSPQSGATFRTKCSRIAVGTAINRAAVQNLFRLKFIEDKTNIIILGGVGLGKTHLATALGYAACLQGKSVLFTTAIDAINTLSAAQAANRLKPELKRYLAPSLLCLNELGLILIA
jgi:DNA replication protein DnaC